MKAWARDWTRLALVIAMALLLACSIQVEFSAYLGCDGRGCRISASARVLQGDAIEQAKISENQVVLPTATIEKLDVKPGTILVSPDFVRRVKQTSTDGDQTVVATEDASLSEVIEKGSTKTLYRLASDPAVEASAAPLSTKGGPSKDGVFDLTIRKSVDLDAFTRVWIEGSVKFDPSIDVQLDFDPTYAHAYIVGNLEANLRAVGRVGTSAKGYAATKSVVLWDPPEVRVPLPPIGFVPISLSAKLTLRAFVTVQADGSVTVETGFTYVSRGYYGFRYTEDEGLREVADWPTSSTTLQPPTLSVVPPKFTVIAGLRAELEAAFNGGWRWAGGSAGLDVGANVYGRLDVNTAGWSGAVGFSADATAFLKVAFLIFSDEWRTTPMELFRWEKPFAGGKAPSVAGCASWTKGCGPSFGCAKCVDGSSCFADGDCNSGRCSPSGVCVAGDGTRGAGESCSDGEMINFALCKPGLTCVPEGSFFSWAFNCRKPQCGNWTKDPDETDRDCGGAAAEGQAPACRRCRPGLGCRFNTDCTTGVCREGVCQVR